MEAILWDGNKQLNGSLQLKAKSLFFTLSDFNMTNLNFEIEYAEISEVKHHKVYNIATAGLAIICKNGQRNVFVLENPQTAINKIRERLDSKDVTKTED